jgi:thymidylate synthase
MIADALSMDVGTYYHFAQNFHLYIKQLKDHAGY